MTSAAMLRRDLFVLGVRPGDTLLVHTSLSSLGWVPNGAQTVAQILVESVCPGGLICVPTFSGQNSDPANWIAPPVPKSWHEDIRQSLPAFDPAITPTRAMGVINDVIRTMPGAVRNGHPRSSFTAVGEGAAECVEHFELAAEFGEHSVLARLYERDARVLFLGTGFANCTCFHLAEHRAGVLGTIKEGAAMMVDGVRQWVSFTGARYDDDDFEALGAAFETQSETIQVGQVGQAHSRLFSLREAVDFAQNWLRAQRAPATKQPMRSLRRKR